jgi:hypothetical protein
MTDDDLRALVARATPAACNCGATRWAAWASVPEHEWPAGLMQAVGSLRAATDDTAEPTFEEHHPTGTRYDSADAPVSLPHFPFNRCEVFACRQCQRVVLRYTEFGGYYVDARARWIADPALVLDPAG